VIRTMKKHTLWKGIGKGIQRGQDKDKDKDSSSSLSDVGKKAKRFDLESAYRLYPLKKGKTKGLQRLAKEIETEEDFQALLAAITKYSRDDEVKRGFIKHFSTFASEWRDWLDEDAGRSSRVAAPPPLKSVTDTDREEDAHAS
jgi:hypothetical protein